MLLIYLTLLAQSLEIDQNGGPVDILIDNKRVFTVESEYLGSLSSSLDEVLKNVREGDNHIRIAQDGSEISYTVNIPNSSNSGGGENVNQSILDILNETLRDYVKRDEINMSDYYTKGESTAFRDGVLESLDHITKIVVEDVYNRSQSDTLFYRKSATYNKTEIEETYARKDDTAEMKETFEKSLAERALRNETYNRATIDATFAKKDELPGDVDMSEYYRKEDVLNKTEVNDIFATKADLPNMSEYLTVDQADNRFATKEDIVPQPDMSNYVTRDDLINVDNLANYDTKGETQGNFQKLWNEFMYTLETNYYNTSAVDDILADYTLKTDMPDMSTYIQKADLDLDKINKLFNEDEIEVRQDTRTTNIKFTASPYSAGPVIGIQSVDDGLYGEWTFIGEGRIDVMNTDGAYVALNIPKLQSDELKNADGVEYALKTDIPAAQDLSPYALKTEVPDSYTKAESDGMYAKYADTVIGEPSRETIPSLTINGYNSAGAVYLRINGMDSHVIDFQTDRDGGLEILTDNNLAAYFHHGYAYVPNLYKDSERTKPYITRDDVPDSYTKAQTDEMFAEKSELGAYVTHSEISAYDTREVSDTKYYKRNDYVEITSDGPCGVIELKHDLGGSVCKAVLGIGESHGTTCLYIKIVDEDREIIVAEFNRERIYVNASLYDGDGNEYVTEARLSTGSHTVTHLSPISGDHTAADYTVGTPVYMSGDVFVRVNNTWRLSNATNRIDCIPSVRPSGEWREYLGICTEVLSDTNEVRFASHGDFLVTVDDSSTFKVGDIIYLTESGGIGVIPDDTALTVRVSRSIIGVVTRVVDGGTVAVFKD